MPLYYALYETSAQATVMRVAPTPVVAGTLKVYHSLLPTALVSDTSTIPFSDGLLRALERLVAAECAIAMGPEQRKKRMIGPETIARWRMLAERGLRDENFRLRVMGSGTQERIVEVDA